jgi:hypothetical protein
MPCFFYRRCGLRMVSPSPEPAGAIGACRSPGRPVGAGSRSPAPAGGPVPARRPLDWWAPRAHGQRGGELSPTPGPDPAPEGDAVFVLPSWLHGCVSKARSRTPVCTGSGPLGPSPRSGGDVLRGHPQSHGRLFVLPGPGGRPGGGEPGRQPHPPLTAEGDAVYVLPQWLTWRVSTAGSRTRRRPDSGPTVDAGPHGAASFVDCRRYQVDHSYTSGGQPGPRAGSLAGTREDH